MTIYKINHVNRESERRVNNIIRGLGGTATHSHLAAVIRCTPLKVPYDQFSYLGVGLVDRQQYGLDSHEAVYITPAAVSLVKNFYMAFPANPVPLDLKVPDCIHDGCIGLDLSAEWLPMYPVCGSLEKEGRPHFVIKSTDVGLYPARLMYGGTESAQVSDAEFERRCMELLDLIWEVGFGRVHYPVERGVIFWEQGKLIPRYASAPAEGKTGTKNYSRANVDKARGGKLRKSQEGLIKNLRNMAAVFTGTLTIPFENGIPGTIKFEDYVYTRKP